MYVHFYYDIRSLEYFNRVPLLLDTCLNIYFNGKLEYHTKTTR